MANGITSIDMQQIPERFRRIVCDQLGIPETDVTPEKNFQEDLGADSLDRVELIMAVEDEFVLEIPDADAETLTTVGAVLDYVAKRKA